MIPNLPFEGPEKKLFITFTPKSPGLRTISVAALNNILIAASCSVLSVTRNTHVDAYLLSESSLFISDSTFMIKTCGSTTLLRALPVLLKAAADIGLFPAAVQYSRVQFCYPDRQPFPHDSYTNEVAYLDRVLKFEGRPFQLGSSTGAADWHVYIAQIVPQMSHPLPQTLEVFMFDLDPAAMTHYLHHDSLNRGGSEPAVKATAVRSGITGLLKKNSEIDAYNFTPCGFSLNAINDDAYYTIHVSPEPDASYVSFETTVDTADLAALVAAVIKLFRPGRFTVAYLGTADAQGLRQNPKAPVHWLTLAKLLASEYVLTSDPAIVQATGSIWTTVATYIRSHRGRVEDSMMSTALPVIARDTVFDSLLSRLDNVHYSSSDDICIRAHSAISRKHHIERPTFVIDLEELHRRALSVADALGSRFSLRYAVRCNSDPAVLSLLGFMGWSFEAVSIAEVNALCNAGIKRNKIVFASPLLTPGVITRLRDVGVISLFSSPGDALRRAILNADVALEVRVPICNVVETVAICEDILSLGKSVHSFALDCDPDVYLRGPDSIQATLAEGLTTLRAVLNRLPAPTVENVIISVGELFPGCRDSGVESPSKELSAIYPQFRNICFDPGRWVVGHCTSLLVRVIGRRVRSEPVLSEQRELTGRKPATEAERYCYYLNDGVYGAFSFVIMERSGQKDAQNRVPAPEVVYRTGQRAKSEACSTVQCDMFPFSRDTSVVSSDDDCTGTLGPVKQHASTLFGPTCDALDRIWTGQLPMLEIGDMLLFRDMGAYAASAVSSFNGFAKKFDTIYVIGRDSISSPHCSDGSCE